MVCNVNHAIQAQKPVVTIVPARNRPSTLAPSLCCEAQPLPLCISQRSSMRCSILPNRSGKFSGTIISLIPFSPSSKARYATTKTDPYSPKPSRPSPPDHSVMPIFWNVEHPARTATAATTIIAAFMSSLLVDCRVYCAALSASICACNASMIGSKSSTFLIFAPLAFTPSDFALPSAFRA